MRRELKGITGTFHPGKHGHGHKAYPDEKGTESRPEPRPDPGPDVTRHIPMRRELKEIFSHLNSLQEARHKAYPDEKGTESSQSLPSCAGPAWSQGISR